MIKKCSEKDNFSYLLASLIFLLFSSSCLDQFMPGQGGNLIIIATIISMMIGVWSVRSTRYAFNTGIGLVITAIFVTGLIELLEFAQIDFILPLVMLGFFSITLKMAAEQALFSGQVTGNSIMGSICIFLLLGLIWAVLFLLLIEFIPTSFSGIEYTGWKENLPDFVYFSFVTLTTLGFGDLLPVAPLARFLVYIEAIVGVFYMAIVVSSLVGARMSGSKN
ncbi:MAG: hypothetical protein KAI17_26305 [Thiotrichaceae bacterium]|nr:hypothetical protein [Thiotrichaceae bacterium]